MSERSDRTPVVVAPLADASPRRSLLVATAGGHLTQLMVLAPRLGIALDHVQWVTNATEQSRSLLAGRDVVWAPYGRPRDAGALARHLTLAAATVRRGRHDMVVSTGASLAPPFLAIARALRIPTHFIESATRVAGPSFTGRLVSHIPKVNLYSQHPTWASGRWRFGGSVFDGWEATITNWPPKVRTVLVTVGSARGFPFPAMVEAVRRSVPGDASVTWQIGDADVPRLVGRVIREAAEDQMRELMATSDVVVSHAGTGSALSCLQAGRCPILIPRSPKRAEHVDGHQYEIATMLAGLGLAVAREPDELEERDFHLAAAMQPAPSTTLPFRLS